MCARNVALLLVAILSGLTWIPGATRPTSAQYSWSGWYLYGTAGWGWRSENSYPSQSYYESLGANFAAGAGYGGTSGGGASKHDGPAASLGFGYNIQSGPLVFGIDYEFLYANVQNKPVLGQTSFTRGTGIYAPAYTAFNYDTADGDSNKWFGVFKAKLGAAVGRFNPYVTGGAAYRLSYNTSDPTIITYTYAAGMGMPSTTTTSVTYKGVNHANAWGWVAGAGFDYAVTDALLVKAEYLHFDFGDDTYMDPVATALTGAIVTLPFKRQIDLVRLGLAYRFNFGYSPSY